MPIRRIRYSEIPKRVVKRGWSQTEAWKEALSVFADGLKPMEVIELSVERGPDGKAPSAHGINALASRLRNYVKGAGLHYDIIGYKEKSVIYIVGR
jgi:hypothetical protein